MLYRPGKGLQGSSRGGKRKSRRNSLLHNQVKDQHQGPVAQPEWIRKPQHLSHQQSQRNGTIKEGGEPIADLRNRREPWRNHNSQEQRTLYRAEGPKPRVSKQGWSEERSDQRSWQVQEEASPMQRALPSDNRTVPGVSVAHGRGPQRQASVNGTHRLARPQAQPCQSQVYPPASGSGTLAHRNMPPGLQRPQSYNRKQLYSQSSYPSVPLPPSAYHKAGPKEFDEGVYSVSYDQRGPCPPGQNSSVPVYQHGGKSSNEVSNQHSSSVQQVPSNSEGQWQNPQQDEKSLAHTYGDHLSKYSEADHLKRYQIPPPAPHYHSGVPDFSSCNRPPNPPPGSSQNSNLLIHQSEASPYEEPLVAIIPETFGGEREGEVDDYDDQPSYVEQAVDEPEVYAEKVPPGQHLSIPGYGLGEPSPSKTRVDNVQSGNMACVDGGSAKPLHDVSRERASKKVLIQGTGGRRPDGTWRKPRYKKVGYSNDDDPKYISKGLIQKRIKEIYVAGAMSKRQAERIVLNELTHPKTEVKSEQKLKREESRVRKKERKKRLTVNIATIRRRIFQLFEKAEGKNQEALRLIAPNHLEITKLVSRVVEVAKQIQRKDELEFNNLVVHSNEPYIICKSIKRSTYFSDWVWGFCRKESGTKEDSTKRGSAGQSLKRLRKKLKQIKILEEKKKNGAALNDDQIKKLGRKSEIEAMIEELNQPGCVTTKT